MTTKRLRAMLDLARENHCLLRWREATGEWTFVPIAENTVTKIPTNPQAVDGAAEDEEIVL
jgi:hypothetical protein